MLNVARIKIHTFLNKFKKKKEAGVLGTINPYMTEYGGKGIKKKVPVLEKVASAPPREYPFLNEMKGVMVSDVLWVAGKFVRKVKKERRMTADEIAKACEGIMWQ